MKTKIGTNRNPVITAAQVGEYLPLDYVQGNTTEKVKESDGWTRTVKNWIQESGKVKISLRETKKLINSFVS